MTGVCAATSDCYPNSNDCPFGGAWGAPSVDACFAQNCCFESMYCTKGGLDVAACTSCLEAGQADALCAPMIEASLLVQAPAISDSSRGWSGV